MKGGKRVFAENQALEGLWIAFKLGDREAFETIYRHFIQDLYSFGCNIYSDPEVVQDAIQELFVDLWRYKSGLASTDNVKKYLFKALSTRLAKVYKKQQAELVKSRNYQVAQVLFIGSAEDELIQSQRSKERVEKLNKSLSSLPVRQRELIDLLFFQDFSYEEIANHMSIDIRSVYTLAWKAIKKLKSEMFIIAYFFLKIFF